MQCLVALVCFWRYIFARTLNESPAFDTLAVLAISWESSDISIFVNFIAEMVGFQSGHRLTLQSSLPELNDTNKSDNLRVVARIN